MAWNDDMDVNDPSLYTPRKAPRVRKVGRGNPSRKRDDEAAREEMPARFGATERDGSYIFDEAESWNEPLSEIPVIKPERAKTAGGHGAEGENPYAQKRAQTVYSAGNKRAKSAANSIGRGRPIAYAMVSIICMAVLTFLCVMMMPQTAGYFWKDFDNYAFINGEVLRYDANAVNNYKQYRNYLKQDMIYQGIFVDDVYVGGNTPAQAEQLLGGNGSAVTNAFALTVNIGNQTWNFDNTNIPAVRTIDAVLRQAYAIGRTNTTQILGTSRTPFRERVDTVMNLLHHYVYLKSSITYDHDAVRAKVNEIVAYVNRDPVDATIKTFDFNTRGFTFTDEQPGIKLDGDALFTQVTAKLDAGTINETINVVPQIIQPSVTKAALANQFKMISAFTTDTTSASNRNNNINLACQSINGKVLLPGETFSFNETTGKRTADKGYQMASAIVGGELVDDYGGGVCQVSSTLFNAVERANLEIVSRNPHAWPSTYVKIGEDATVNWPSLDFKFKNNQTTPVFVIMYYKSRKCSAEIWGQTMGDGVTIDLESKIIRTIDPPTSVNYVQNTSMAVGTSEETIKARTGYVVETYKVWYLNGVETKRELQYTTTYKAYQRTVEYN